MEVEGGSEELDKIKYALMIHVPGESPETYSKFYETADSIDWYVGVGGMEQAEELMKQLTSDGFTTVNLCGDFDEATTQRFSEIGKGEVKVRAARYLPEEEKKLESLNSAKEYGFLSYMPGLKQIDQILLESQECNTRVMLVPDLAQACVAAEELIRAGVDLIELCGWFDSEKTKTVIDTIQCTVPVGSCGLSS